MEKKRLEWSADRRLIREMAQQRKGEAGTFFVATDKDISSGEMVEVEVSFAGFPQTFAIGGVVSAVRKFAAGDLPAGVTIAVQENHAGRLTKVIAFAEGEAVNWSARKHDRFPLNLDVELEVKGARLVVRTEDISMGGARLSMDGELPAMGDPVRLIFPRQGSFFALKIDGRVTWLNFFRESRGFGVQFIGGSRGWEKKLTRLVQAGAVAAD